MEEKVDVRRASVLGAAGAFVFGMLASELVHSLWWVAALLGFIAGYIAYDPKAFWCACSAAFRSAWHKTFHRQKKERVEYPAWALSLWHWDIASRYCFVVSICFWVFILLVVARDISREPVNMEYIASLFPSLGFFGWSIFKLRSVILKRALSEIVAGGRERAEKDTKELKRDVLLTSPLCLPFTFSWILLKGLFWSAKRVLTFLRHFGIAIFAFTISDGRIATAIGASMGVAFGFFAGNIFLGGLIGSVIAGTLAMLSNKYKPRFARK